MHQEHFLTTVFLLISVSLYWPAFAGLVNQPAAPSIYAVDIVVDPTFKPRVYAAARTTIEQDVLYWGIALLPKCACWRVLAPELSY